MLENLRLSFQGIWSHKMRSFNRRYNCNNRCNTNNNTQHS